jgi:hypothetical protein
MASGECPVRMVCETAFGRMRGEDLALLVFMASLRWSRMGSMVEQVVGEENHQAAKDAKMSGHLLFPSIRSLRVPGVLAVHLSFTQVFSTPCSE